MARKKPGSERKLNRKESFRLIFEERQEDDATPEASVVALDANRKPIETADVKDDGAVAFKASTLKRAETFHIGPRGADLSEQREQFVPFHGHQIRDAIANEAPISLTRRVWIQFLQIKLCVAGTAKHCHWHPWLTEINNARLQTLAAIGPVQPGAQQLVLGDLLEPVFAGWRHCKPICDGVVEVYRRTCCCPPILVYDPRIAEILQGLEELVVELPPPLPDSPPFESLPFHKSGTPDRLTLNAEADLQAVKTLSGQAQVDYINARTYLFCYCTTLKLVASGFLQPDGSFNICWWEPLRIMFPGCRDRLAFKIKQLVNGVTVTVYDGVAANQWFFYENDIELETFHPDTIVCDEPPVPPPGADVKSVMLEMIGSTESRHLNSPLPDTWDGVQAPPVNGGLAFPADPLADPATPHNKNYGWGETLGLRYLFFEDLEPIARYFRVSVVKANAFGNPTGLRTYLDHPLAWVWYRRRIGGSIVREVEPLKDGEYYKIPYESLYQAHLLFGETGKWGARQIHAPVDTTKFHDAGADDKYLVTFELYNAAKQQIEPAGAGEGAIGANFNFQAWDQNNLAATVAVNHKALTHYFWWDNQATTAEIVEIPGVGDCQFLEGPGATTVAMSYRAFHLTPRFLYFHNVRHQKGLHGGWQTWVANRASNENPGITPSKTYAVMLDGETQCTFGVEVRTYAKITAGSGRIRTYDRRDNGSFAIVNTDVP